jgi:CubicO group peptidase (beta-lactamase class C family)
MRTLVTLLALPLLVAACGSGPRGPGRAAEARVAALLTAYTGADRPGACLLARHGGAVVYERCVGLAELETGRAATPETNFRLASLTKQFTATAVLRLVQDGALTTTTSLREVFPDFPPYGAAITLHHLMTHTSGLIDYEDLMGADTTEQIKDAGVLALMKAQDSTYFPPGSAFRYSNSAYAVLAQVVERKSGMPFARYLKTIIFDPLGMTNTVAYEAGVTTVAHRAYGYSRRADGSWARTDQSPTSAVLGDGGIYSSLRDLSRWLAVVEGRRQLLAPAIAARAFEEARLTGGAGAGYGYGWFLDEYRGHRRYRHEGSTIGFRNAVQRLPDADLSVLFLSNRDTVDPALVDSIVDVFLDRYGGA